MARVALGPRGSAKDPSQKPPDQAWPMPLMVQYSWTGQPWASVQVRTR